LNWIIIVFMSRIQRFLLTTFFLMLAGVTYGQWESIQQEGELGISACVAHYFGDLNTSGRINRPKPMVGAFFRRQFGNYVAMRVSGHYAQVGYSDIYNKDNEYMRRRNLSFNSNIFELSLMGDFNFFKFVPADPYHCFTPFVSIGLGIFTFDPYAYLGNQKYYLRTLGTEGQLSAAYPDRTPYNTMAFCIPFGFGFKYALNDRYNIGVEVGYRFTSTDYLDDVSKTYVGADKFPPMPDGTQTPAYLFQDRSYETGDIIGIEGRQRGIPTQKDQYGFAEITFSVNLWSYRCPKAR